MRNKEKNAELVLSALLKSSQETKQSATPSPSIAPETPQPMHADPLDVGDVGPSAVPQARLLLLAEEEEGARTMLSLTDAGVEE